MTGSVMYFNTQLHRCNTYTECPTQMGTTSDSILQFLNPHILKSKTCFEKFVKKSFIWHLETQQNQIGSIFKLNFKKKYQNAKMVLCPASSSPFLPPPPLAKFQKQIVPCLLLPHPNLAIFLQWGWG